MVRRPHYIALVLIVLVVLILLKLPSQTTHNLKLAIGSLFLPLFGASATAGNAAEKAGLALVPKAELIRQNERLRLENERYRLRIMQSEEAWRENARLRQHLGWIQQNPWEFKLARVIGHDPANWWSVIHIDLGARDGVRLHLPVLTADGLIGRVSVVSATQSQVVLLGDPNLRVGAIVHEPRESGVIVSSSTSPFDPTAVELTYLSGNSAVKPGHTVMTSGDGGVFPKGIKIGTVIETRVVNHGLATEARVKLAANLKTLEDVWVMFP